MKFALKLAALVVGVVVLWTEHVQSFSAIKQNLLLDVTANDDVWKEHLDVSIKVNKKTLSAAANKVLVGLKVIEAMSAEAVDPDPKPDQEQAVRTTGEKGHEPEPKAELVVANALQIVVDVASSYNNHGMALDFAFDAIATAITCKTLMYILVQLHAIKDNNDTQNDAIPRQTQEVWHTLVHVLDKVAVFKKSFHKEFKLYQTWKTVANRDATKDPPSDYSEFMGLVEKSLQESCQLSTFDEIKKHLHFDKPEDWEEMFSRCQNSINKMFKDIPNKTMNIKVWEIVLNKPEYKEQPVPTLN